MTTKSKVIITTIIGLAVIILAGIFILTAVFSTSGTSPQTTWVGEGKGGGGSFEAPITLRTMSNSVGEIFATEDDSSPYPFIETAGATAAEVDQKIIKTGYLDLEVESVDETVSKITSLAVGKGGYLQESSVYEREDGTKYGNLTARVPTNEFENTASEIKKMSVAVNSETASGQDVTEQFTDLEARLRNAEAQETEYLEILKKATTVTDILSVQSYLGQVRGEIELLQGQIKYLENQTNYSTLTISLSEEPTLKIPSKEFRPWSAIKEAGQALVTVFQSLIITAIWLVIVFGGLMLPVVVVAALIYWLIRRKFRSQKTRR